MGKDNDFKALKMMLVNLNESNKLDGDPILLDIAAYFTGFLDIRK